MDYGFDPKTKEDKYSEKNTGADKLMQQSSGGGSVPTSSSAVSPGAVEITRPAGGALPPETKTDDSRTRDLRGRDR